ISDGHDIGTFNVLRFPADNGGVAEDGREVFIGQTQLDLIGLQADITVNGSCRSKAVTLPFVTTENKIGVLLEYTGGGGAHLIFQVGDFVDARSFYLKGFATVVNEPHIGIGSYPNLVTRL